MISYTKGNLLESSAEALVNTVNTVGVMGKGIALQFAETYKRNLHLYRQACKNGSFTIGKLLIVEDHDLQGSRIIVNFPTKKHWRSKSRYEYIETGLVKLREYLNEGHVKSIAIPPLGCGNGGLDWNRVIHMIVGHLEDTDCNIIVFEPNSDIKAQLQRAKPKGRASLTPARALLLSALYDFEKFGEPASLFVANKLSYFLGLLGETDFSKIDFKAAQYGPFSIAVQHMVYSINGTFIHGFEQFKAGAFDSLQLDYSKKDELDEFVTSQLSDEQKIRLDSLIELVYDFRSTYALELLSTVAFILASNPSADIDYIKESMKKWSTRKEKLADDYGLDIALNHLRKYSISIAIR